MLAVVVASTQGLDAGTVSEHGPNACESVPSSERESIVGVFGQDGRRWLTEVLDDRLREDLSARRSLAIHDTDESLQRASPTPTVTPLVTSVLDSYPTPAPLPEGARADTIPPLLKSTFDAYPMIRGTRYVFRYTYRRGGVRWRSSIVTQTIVGQWALGDGLARVDSRVEERVLHPPTWAWFRSAASELDKSVEGVDHFG